MKSHSKYPVFMDRMCFGLVCLFSFLALIPFVMLVFELFRKGLKHFNWDFFMEKAPASIEALLAQMEDEPVRGGILNGIYGSFSVIAIALAPAVPIGILAGIYMYENRTHKLSVITQYTNGILRGTPSIVIGLVVYLWISGSFLDSPIGAGGFSLAVLLLPFIIQSTLQTLTELPENLKESGFALGGSYTNVWFKIILPSIRGKLLTRILRVSAQAIGATAPLMITVLGTSMINWDINNPATTLSLLIWHFFNNPNMTDLMWATSLFLFLIVVLFNFTTHEK
jgi:phosphate transport system permease protein